MYQLGVVGHTCNSSARGTEAGGLSQVPGQTGLHSDSLSQNQANIQRILMHQVLAKVWRGHTSRMVLETQRPFHNTAPLCLRALAPFRFKWGRMGGGGNHG